MTAFSSNLKNRFKHIIPIFFWILIWFIASLSIDREVYLPSPVSVFQKIISFSKDTSFYISLLSTLSRGLIAFLLSTLLGLILGFMCNFNKHLHTMMLPLINILRSVPVISIIFLIIIYTNAEMVPIVVSFILCFPIIWTTTTTALKTVPKTLLDMSKTYSISRPKKLLYIYLPSILPALFASMVSTLGLTWKVIATSEALVHPKYSIGKNLALAKINIDTTSLFAWTVVLLVLGIIFESLLQFAFKKILHKRFGVMMND